MRKILPKDKREWMNFLKNNSLVLLGTFVLAFGVTMFIFPFDLVTGGVSGIGIILSKAFAEIPYLSEIGPDIYSSVINWILFIVGYFLLGKAFAAKTLLSTAFYPVALFISEYIVRSSPLAPLLDLSLGGASDQGTALIIATIFGGVLIGAGCAFTFLGGGSTGGVDVIALSLSKYFRHLKSSVAFFICDTVVIVAGVFAIHQIVVSLLGIVSALVCAVMIDKIFIGGNSAFIAHVVSDKYEEINRAVIDRMARTTTIVDAIGGYSGEKKKLVIVTFDMRQYPLFTHLISTIDENAFITVHRAHEIDGQGWTFAIEELPKK